MKVIHLNLKKHEAKVMAQNTDDLWYLSHLIDSGDYVKGRTFRKIKIGKEDERGSKSVKKPVYLKIHVEKTEFSENANILRVSGKITEAPEDISAGSYHTFNIEANTILTIVKDSWLKFHLDKLKEASQQKTTKLLVCVFDREEVTFALMKKYGYTILSEFKGLVQKKDNDTVIKSDFYPSIIRMLQDYVPRYSIEKIILASPAFFKDDLMKQVTSNELKKKIILATCNNIGRNGIDEVLKRPEVKEALNQDRVAQEMIVVEQILDEISKEGLATYGVSGTKEAAIAGAIKLLAITDNLIRAKRVSNSYGEIDYILRQTDSCKGEIKIISSEHSGGKKLDGLGGIAAILRYRLKY